MSLCTPVYIPVHIFMTDSKYEQILTGIMKILEKNIKGISKNMLQIELAKQGIASRTTFYHHWEAIEKSGIIEKKTIKNQLTHYIPTEQNKVLIKLENDLKIATNLLNLLEKDPFVGDCFASDQTFNNSQLIHLIKKASKYVTSRDNNHQLFEGIETSKPSKEYFPAGTVYSLMARQNIVKDLPSFLIYYINNLNKQYSESVKDEFLRLLIPIVNQCLKILQSDYYESFSYSNFFKEEFSKNLPENKYVNILVVKGNTTPDLVLEFLKTLGRYSMCFSIKQELDKKHDSTKQLEIIHNFIKTFFEPFLGKNNIVDTNSKIPISITRKFVTYKIIDPLINNTDLKPVRDYYINLFMDLELFSKDERLKLREKYGHS